MAGWFGAGVLTAGVSAALLAGAGAAQADTDTGSDNGTSSASTDSDAGSSATRDRGSASVSADSEKPTPQRRGVRQRGDSAGADSDRGSRVGGSQTAESQKSDADAAEETETETEAEADADAAEETEAEAETETAADAETAGEVETETVEADVEATETESAIELEPASGESESKSSVTSLVAEEAPKAATEGVPIASVAPTPSGPQVVAVPLAVEEPVPAPQHFLGPFQPDYPPLVRALGSAVFNFIGALVQAFDGRPSVPHALRDSVRVSSSTLVISPGNEVPADWYYPTQGQPERLIYLQHGILASSPMYSHTAAYLAERTNSVVIATTLTSNPFADDNLWLGGDGMHKAVAQLFLDENRAALNASLTTATLKAGTQSLTVPTEFVLVGHSLGGGFAPGVAGHYADGLVARRAAGQVAANHAAGVVLLDGVPFSPIMPNALGRMKQLEESNNGDPADYIPVYQIGAPLNFLNANSAVNEELSVARPGKFNGVVINNGVHMDGMLGGSPVIQFSAYLVAGFPRTQNPPAVQLLMAGWINDLFEGDIDPTVGRCVGDDCQGVYGGSGDTIVIPTDEGDASAVVIDAGSLPVSESLRAYRFQPRTADSIVLPQGLRRAVPLHTAV
ncbi:MAG: alpha/beta hydrolase [Dietzia sp.]|nr:alpha/beta hydrolase [Dietzia sp.]